MDNVFPEVPIRQWVLSFPFNLRYLFAYNKKALSKSLEISIRTINRFYLNRSKKMGLKDTKAGSVTLVQRFGGSLNFNPHFHILYPDGVWDDSGKFHKVLLPTNDEVNELVNKLKIRIFRSLEKLGYIDGYQVSEDDELCQEFPGLAESISSSIQRKTNKGKKVEELGRAFDLLWNPKTGKLCAYKDGFSLHAATVIAAKDRIGLEHLCRYIARPAISNDRLSLGNDGKILYKLKRPYNNGTTHLKFTSEEFIEKLIALVPPPRTNLTRYHGALGPHSKLRKKIVKKNKKKKGIKVKYRISWAKLLKRVFDFEVDLCACGSKLRILSAILDQEVAVGIMQSLKIEVYIPELSPSRISSFFDSA